MQPGDIVWIVIALAHFPEYGILFFRQKSCLKIQDKIHIP